MDSKYLNFEYVEKPWGNYKRFTLNTVSTVKVLTLNPNSSLSLQYHHKREEFWRILPGGSGEVTVGDDVHAVNPGDEIFIPQGVNHRLKSFDTPVYFLEIAFGEFDEEDIVRLEDSYGRV